MFRNRVNSHHEVYVQFTFANPASLITGIKSTPVISWMRFVKKYDEQMAKYKKSGMVTLFDTQNTKEKLAEFVILYDA